MELSDRVAVITGANGGLGRALVSSFGAAGARVAALDLRFDDDFDDLLREACPGGIAVAVDIRSASAVDCAFDEVAGTLGPTQILVNAAGVREIKTIADIAPEEWDQVLAVNLTGTFHAMQAACRQMLPMARGTMVNISSGAGLTGVGSRPAYTASKHGVIGLTKAAARDLGGHGIRVNVICPGLINTPLTAAYAEEPSFLQALPGTVPLGTIGTPQDVAEAALFLVSDRAKYLTGTVLSVDGGWIAEKSFDPFGQFAASSIAGRPLSG